MNVPSMAFVGAAEPAKMYFVLVAGFSFLDNLGDLSVNSQNSLITPRTEACKTLA